MKRLLILLLACCVFGLSGCGRETGEDKATINFEDDILLGNFKLVCDQIGIDPQGITAFEPVENEDLPLEYNFTYNELILHLNCNEDSTVDSVSLETGIKLFDKTEGAYNIGGYEPNAAFVPQLKSFAQDLVKEQLAYLIRHLLPMSGIPVANITFIH